MGAHGQGPVREGEKKHRGGHHLAASWGGGIDMIGEKVGGGGYNNAKHNY